MALTCRWMGTNLLLTISQLSTQREANVRPKWPLSVGNVMCSLWETRHSEESCRPLEVGTTV